MTVALPVHPPADRRRFLWPAALVLLAAGAFALTGWAVSGSMSDYYAAIALSMSRSWSNFFFGAFDPAGTVTLDKIPGSFWIPALAVRLFGFSPAAVILPNALAAAGAVVISAVTARRLAGTGAGVLTGAIVATTPILIAVARSNQPQTFFVLALSLVAWAATKAVQRASLRWYLVAGLFVALAFQTYMLEAWAVWPALASAYLCTRQSWWRRLWHTGVAGVVSLAASVVWVVIVWLIPASDRPYVGGTNGNNPWEMVFGYNGLGRFGATSDSDAYRSFTPSFAGDPGVLRLFNTQLAGQIGWLLPTAAVAIVVLAVLRWRLPLVVFLGGWLLTYAAMFSVVAGMHQFYTSALAIPVALLVATAFAVARSRRMLWPQIALVVVSAGTALVVASMYEDPSPVIATVQGAIALVGIVLLVLERRMRFLRILTAMVVGIGMLLTPAVWSVITIGTPSSINPTAAGVSQMSTGSFAGLAGMPGNVRGGGQAGMGQGPGSFAPPGDGAGGAPGTGRGDGTGAPPEAGAGGGFGGGLGMAGSASELLTYLEEHQGSATYLVATFGAQTAASLIIESDGASVLPIGGFDGSDSVPTLGEFQRMVASGEVDYVLGSGGGFGGGGFGGSQGSSTTTTEISAWVTANCAAVDDAPGGVTLYSCAE